MPDPKQFTLSIALGNGAMSTRDDIAVALEHVADGLDAGMPAVGDGGPIRDSNGNTVGRWQVI